MRLCERGPRRIYPQYTLPQRLEYLYEAARKGWLWIARTGGQICAFAVVVPFQRMVHIDAFVGTGELARAGLAELKCRFRQIHYVRDGKRYKHNFL